MRKKFKNAMRAIRRFSKASAMPIGWTSFILIMGVVGGLEAETITFNQFLVSFFILVSIMVWSVCMGGGFSYYGGEGNE